MSVLSIWYVMLTDDVASDKSFPRGPKVKTTMFKVSEPFFWSGISEGDLERDQRIVGMFPCPS